MRYLARLFQRAFTPVEVSDTCGVRHLLGMRSR